MDIKVKLLREDGDTTIWFKFFDKDGVLTNNEFTMTYEEWDAVKKTRLEKNVWMLDIQRNEQHERIEWLLEPPRMVHILRALSDNPPDDIEYYYALGGISVEYWEKFGLPQHQFLADAKIAKEVLLIILDRPQTSQGEPL